MKMAPMTVDERRRLHNLEKQYVEIDERLTKIEDKLMTMFAWVKGIAIGIGIGALIFGYISVKQLLEAIK